jgi:hypothetical protein
MIYHFLCVCTQVRCREDKLKSSGDVMAPPGEPACHYVGRFIDSFAQGGGLACKGGGRVHHHVEGGEVKSDSLSRESKVQMTWNSGLHFFLFWKLNWRELTSVPPNI